MPTGASAIAPVSPPVNPPLGPSAGPRARRSQTTLLVPLQLQGLEADRQYNIAKLFPGKAIRRMPFRTAFAHVHATKLAARKLRLAPLQPNPTLLYQLALGQPIQVATKEETQAANDMVKQSMSLSSSEDLSVSCTMHPYQSNILPQ